VAELAPNSQSLGGLDVDISCCGDIRYSTYEYGHKEVSRQINFYGMKFYVMGTRRP
jgi:hypothetical protein